MLCDKPAKLLVWDWIDKKVYIDLDCRAGVIDLMHTGIVRIEAHGFLRRDAVYSHLRLALCRAYLCGYRPITRSRGCNHTYIRATATPSKTHHAMYDYITISGVDAVGPV
jgi:hypothetical protein